MSWSKLPINKIFNFEKGTLQSSKNTQGDYDFITASSEWKNHDSYSHDCEALVFAMAASGSLGRTHYVNGKFIASDLCFIITPKGEYKDKVNLKFYYRYFNAIRELLVKALATGSAKLSINAGNFGKYEIIIGEIEEQNKLIEKLDFIISKRTEISEYIERNIQLSKNLKSSILQDAIQGKLVSQDPSDEPASILIEKIQVEKAKLIAEGKLKKQKPLTPINPEEIPYELPKGWEWVRLGIVADIVRGGSPRPAGDPTYYDGKIPFLKVGDLTRDTNIYLNNYTYTIKEAGLHRTRLVEPNTLLLTNSGATLGVPKICLFETTFNDGIAAFINFSENIYKEYIYYFLFGKTKWFLEVASRGQGQPNLNTDIVGETLLPLPPLQEQRRIVEKIDELMKSCELLGEQVRQAKERSDKLMESVLQGVFNG